MDRFAILLSAPIEATPALCAALEGRRVIAADGGIRHAEPLGLVPELWVGDFDSVPASLPPSMSEIPRAEASRLKDETDGELAAEAAIERGARDLLFVGALGGARSDHAFSNLVLALRYAGEGLRVSLFDGRERAVPLGREPVRLDLPPGTPFSILRFSDVEGLTVTGARWPLHEAELPFRSILTQSNEASGPVEASLKRGCAILLAQSGAGS